MEEGSSIRNANPRHDTAALFDEPEGRPSCHWWPADRPRSGCADRGRSRPRASPGPPARTRARTRPRWSSPAASRACGPARTPAPSSWARNAPAGLTARSGTGRETGFAPPRIFQSFMAIDEYYGHVHNRRAPLGRCQLAPCLLRARCRPAPDGGRGDRAPRRAAPARRARAGGPAAAAPFRHRLVPRPRSRQPPPPPSQSARRPVGAGSHRRLPESVRARSGPCRAGLPALESGRSRNAPAGLTAGSGRGRETGFAPPRIHRTV
jgi:hypothetical protein